MAKFEAIRAVDVCILTWNIDGFRDKDRRMLIWSCLLEWGADIAILTESHLRDEDIFYYPPGCSGDVSKRIYKIKMDNYHIANWSNRDSSEVPIGGGVLILARNGVTTRKTNQEHMPPRPLSCCSIIVEAINGCSDPFKLTGVYFPPPPTARLTERLASPITKPEHQEHVGVEVLNHVICGDFNPTTWKEDFTEWICSAGAWELTDPGESTFEGGGALDKFIILPGTRVFEALLPSSPGYMLGEGVDHMTDIHYPAAVLPRHSLSAHSPVKLVLPFHAELCSRGTRVLSIGSLSTDEWSGRNLSMSLYLAPKMPVFEQHFAGNNVERIYQGIIDAINHVFKDCFKTTGREERPRDPFQIFCEYHSNHRDMAKLKKARIDQDKKE